MAGTEVVLEEVVGGNVVGGSVVDGSVVGGEPGSVTSLSSRRSHSDGSEVMAA